MDRQVDLTTSVLETIATTEDASELNEQIDRLLTTIYQTERSDIATALDATLSTNISKSIKNYLYKTNTILTNEEEVRLSLKKLQEEVRHANILSLTLAFSPTKKMVTNISQMVKHEFGENILIELSVNPELVGGAVIIYNGKYIDLSLQKKLAILFEAKKGEILKFL